ncbi:MAG TPA: hypothetical protein VIG99_01385 [Myxococcaceae bacterium]|jgi:hypothetical protein
MTVRARHRLAMWGLILAASSAQATPARVAALLGNPLFEDDTDADRIPSVAGRYGRSVFLHLTGGAGTQAGLIYGGDHWLVGATYGTPAAYDDLAAIGAELGRALLRPTRLVNVQLVRRLDEESSVGFAINPAFGYTRAFPIAGPITNTFSLELEAIASYSFSSKDLTSDLALSLSYHRFQQRSDGATVAETTHVPSAALRDRTFFRGAFGPTGDLGVYGELARREEGFTQNDPFTSRASLSRYVLVAGAGPRFRPVEWVTLAGAVELDYVLLTGAVDTAGLSFTRTVFPSLQLAAEVSPLSWLVFRGAVARRFSWVTDRPQAGGQTDTTSDAFTWATGAGLRWERLEVDVTVSTALLLNGPAFIGGSAPGLFGSLSLRYPF